MWGGEGGESEAGLKKQSHLFDGSRSRNLGFILRFPSFYASQRREKDTELQHFSKTKSQLCREQLRPRKRTIKSQVEFIKSDIFSNRRV